MTTWSKQQEAIFGWFKSGDGNLVVRARAGTGKTTTIVEALRHAPERDVLLAAFNKRIAKELELKVRKSGGVAEVKTLHGVGFSIVQRYWERCQVDGRRGYQLAKQAAGDQAPDEMIGKVQKLAGTAKGSVTSFNRQDPDLIDELCDIAVRFGLEPDPQWQKDGWTTEKVARFAADAMELARHRAADGPAVIDFDDMLFLPLANDWARPRYELVAVDEAQDMNPAQLELAQRVLVSGGRLAVIGDDRQAIYGFRGADSGALDRLKRELRAQELGLTCTYRCGKAIVDYARRLVPDFEAAEQNGPGIIERIVEEALVDTAKPGDFVLSRKNAPLVSLCLKMLRRNVPARIEGKDVAASLKSVVKRWKPRSIGALMDNINNWAERETERLRQKAGDSDAASDRIAQIQDMAEILLALCDGIAEPGELMVRLETLFGDSDDNPPPAVVFSSIHKSKGLEADRVFVLRKTLYPQRNAFIKRGASDAEATKRASEILEEQNLEYVAVTRAINALVWVD